MIRGMPSGRPCRHPSTSPSPAGGRNTAAGRYRLADDELDPVSLAPPGGSLTAPMPASVRTVHVAEGDRVVVGDAMVVLEAMKMQMSVRTPTAGTVAAVRVREGDVVAAGQVLVDIEEDGA